MTQERVLITYTFIPKDYRWVFRSVQLVLISVPHSLLKVKKKKNQTLKTLSFPKSCMLYFCYRLKTNVVLNNEEMLKGKSQLSLKSRSQIPEKIDVSCRQ